MSKLRDTGAFPLQEPLRTKDECQFARNLIGYVWKEYVSKGEHLVLKIDLIIEGMTKKQRGGCMLWFQDMARHIGCTPREARVFCMNEFFGPIITEVKGEEIVEVRSFGDLSKDEVSFLMDSMQVFCAEEGIPLRQLGENYADSDEKTGGEDHR